MMNNFLDFILKDIETKTAILSSLPTKTKTNQKKYNAQIDEMHKKYSDYKSNLRNYLLAKNRSFEVKETKQTDIEALNEKVVALEHVKFLLNPSNTYLEKLDWLKKGTTNTIIKNMHNIKIFLFKISLLKF